MVAFKDRYWPARQLQDSFSCGTAVRNSLAHSCKLRRHLRNLKEAASRGYLQRKPVPEKERERSPDRKHILMLASAALAGC